MCWKRVLFITAVLCANATALPPGGAYVVVPTKVAVCEEEGRVSKYHTMMSIENYTNADSEIVYRGNVTFPASRGPVRTNLEAYLDSDDRELKKKQYDIRNVTCNHIFVREFIRLSGVKFNFRKCSTIKGSYRFDNLEPNHLFHEITSIFIYGSVTARMQWFYSDGSVLCLDVEVISKPMMKNN